MTTPKLRHHPFLALAAAILGPALAFGAGAAAVALSTTPTHTPALRVTLAPEALTAKAAVLYDPQSHTVLYQKNATAQLPLASLTKLMTAEVVLSVRELDYPVRITAQDLKPEGDWGLKPGETLTLRQLLTFGLTASSNDAIAAAAASLGTDYLERMNDEAARLGLTKTRFLNPTGLDVTGAVAGAYGSAYDVARMTAAFYNDHPQLFAQTLARKAVIEGDAKERTADATAEPIFDIPGVVGAKTGYTDLAGGNLVVVFDLDVGHPVVAVVLGSTREGRFEDIRTLIETARRAQ